MKAWRKLKIQSPYKCQAQLYRCSPVSDSSTHYTIASQLRLLISPIFVFCVPDTKIMHRNETEREDRGVSVPTAARSHTSTKKSPP